MIRLTREPIDPSAVSDAVRHDSAGAVVLFLGTVRDLTGDERTLALEYEAFAPLAESSMTQLADEARARWPIRHAAIVHRLGRLEVGEIAVAVAVSTPHRKDAFDAAEWLMDRIKEVVPVWKKDLAPSGESAWVEGATKS